MTFGGPLQFFANESRFAVRLRAFVTSLAVVILPAILAGCVSSQNAVRDVGVCVTDRADVLQSVDWKGVQPYTIQIIDGDYRPMVLYLEKNRPVILVVENRDDRTHNIWAPNLLKKGVALDSIQFGDKAPAKGCVNGVRIKARSRVTFRFVPLWDGRYEIRDIAFALSPTIGAAAVVNIVAPRIGVAAN